METLFDLYTKRKELKEELTQVEKQLFNHSKDAEHYQSFLTSRVVLTLLHRISKDTYDFSRGRNLKYSVSFSH